MADYFKLAQPVQYYEKFLENETRPDGRELAQFRQTILNVASISTADGSAIVKLGNTSVICGIKVEIATPKPGEPDVGFIVPNVELTPLCSPAFRSGPPSELAQASSLFLDNVIVQSGCVNRKDLCIVHSKHCWVLYCDLVCINYDGNLIDACTMALMAALSTVRLSAVLVDVEAGDITVNTDSSLPLTVHCLPVATTFAIFGEGVVFVDPTQEEEDLVAGLLTIVTVNNKDICTVHKAGGKSLSGAKLNDCIRLAQERESYVGDLITSASASIKH